MARRKNSPTIKTALGALPDNEGTKVLFSEIVIRKTGDGLSDALKADPVAHHIGDEIFVLVRAKVRKVEHEPIDPKDEESFQKRVHKLDATGSVVVDTATAQGLYDELSDEVLRKVEKAQGIERLDFMDETEPPPPDAE
jgi:hypothetical protein